MEPDNQPQPKQEEDFEGYLHSISVTPEGFTSQEWDKLSGVIITVSYHIQC